MQTIAQLWDKLQGIELVQVHPEEMEPMYYHCLEFENPVIVEIGSAHGASSTVFAEAAKEKNGRVYCIDNFVEGYEGQEKFGNYARRAFHKNVMDKYPEYVHLWDMPSTGAINFLSRLLAVSKRKIDVLFVDGDHTYNGVKIDCDLFLPLLAPGGYVGFHDYNNVKYAGVKKAADESGLMFMESAWNLAIFKNI